MIDVAPGCWAEIPNTKFRALEPTPLPPGASGWAGIMTEGSGCIDPKRNCMYLWSGGHGDQSWNGILKVDLTRLTIHFEWDGTPVSQIPPIGSPVETYPDGNPASRHTRDGIEWIASSDVMVCNGGSLWSGSGGNSCQTWAWSPVSRTWIRKKAAPDGQFTNVYSALDPADDSVLYIRPGSDGRLRLYRYRHAIDAWSLIDVTVISASHRRTGAYNPRRKVLILGGMGQIIAWDLNLADPLPVVVRTGLTGGFARPMWGIEDDPVLDCFVVFPQDGHVYYLDPVTWALEQHVLPATSPKPPPARGGGYSGVGGRFRRHAASGQYVLVQHVDDNVFLFRPKSIVEPTITLRAPDVVSLEHEQEV